MKGAGKVFDNCEVVKTGTAFYDKTIPYGVRIVKSPVRYGSGDYEDPPEICNDIEEDFYYIQFESLSEAGRYNIGGGGGSILEEAIAHAEQITGGTIHWNNP